MTDQLTPKELRRKALAHDDAGWWLREFAVSEWARNTVYPAAVERWIRQIGERSQWKRKEEK